jgi:hypothetical protein
MSQEEHKTTETAATPYEVRVTKDFSRIVFSGTLRLQGRQEYEKIHRMLRYAARRAGDSLEIDLRDLQFLNSSGISTFSLFIIDMREINKKIVITGNKAIAWQSKSLANFRRLYDKVVVNLQ